MATHTSKAKVTLEDGIDLQSLNVVENSPTSVNSPNPPRDESPNLGQCGTNLAPAVPHDATTTPSSESGMSPHSRRPSVILRSRSLVIPFLNRTILACRILIRRAFTPNERSSLIEAILSSEDEEEAIRNLSLEDAQTFVDTINEARCTFHRHH